MLLEARNAQVLYVAQNVVGMRRAALSEPVLSAPVLLHGPPNALGRPKDRLSEVRIVASQIVVAVRIKAATGRATAKVKTETDLVV